MSYEVTATRRRPQQFEHLVGQEFVAETLRNSIKSGKIAHAYLFSGPRGCGKTSTARILAKALNCQNGPTDKPCCQCSNCQEITKGSSLDVIEIDGASNTSVENIRQIKDEVMFPPSNCRYKIYIIDEVHMLSVSAFNALLKTIEEPPEYVIFIFATTELQKVPATIKSRCQQYNFRLVSIDKVKECLAQAAAELNIKADDEALFWIARESTGSMRDAYTLFDQVVAFSDGYITYEKIRDKLGLVGIDRLNTLFEACATGKTDEVLNLLDSFLQAGVSIEQLISNSADYLRSLLLIKNGITKESLLGNSVERYSSVVLNTWNVVQIERALSIYLQLYRDIRYSLSPRYELELSYSRLCWLNQYVSNAEVKKAIDAAQALLAGAPVAAAGTVGSASPAGASAGYGATVNQSAASVPGAFSSSDSSATKPTLSINPIPNGLPRLSGLDEPDTDETQVPDDSANGGNTNPFYNGGSLPPEQSVSNLDNNQVVEKELDERLKLHIPEANMVGEDVVPTVYVPTMDSASYNYAPDSSSDDFQSDDSWANTEVPPDDDYSYEEIENQEAESYFEKQSSSAEANKNQYESMTQENQYSISGDSSSGDSKITMADGREVSITQLKGTVLANLSVNDTFTAAALERTGEWSCDADYIEAIVTSDYDMSIIQKCIPVLNEELSRVCGKNMCFKLKLHKQSEDSKDVEVPLQVKLLLETFKGTIVTGKQ